MKNKLIILLISLLFVQSCVMAEGRTDNKTYDEMANRPKNEMPMYGGKKSPFTETSPPQNAEEAAHYKSTCQGLTELGWKYFQQGNRDTAIKRFNQAWLYNPDNPHVWWGFGVIMGNRGEREGEENNLLDSIKFLKKALSLDVGNYKVMIDLSISYTKLGELKIKSNQEAIGNVFDNALQWSIEAEKINSKDASLWLNRAYTQTLMGLFNDAIINFQKAIELEPSNPEAYNDLAWLLSTCSDNQYRNGKEAIKLAKKALDLMPNIPPILDTLAAAYAETGDFKTAIELLKKAINLVSKDSNDDMRLLQEHLNSYEKKQPWREDQR